MPEPSNERIREDRGFFIIDEDGWNALMMDPSLTMLKAVEIAVSRGYAVEDKKEFDA